jgi:RimJ/RimL family protein N-acetyltransferase
MSYLLVTERLRLRPFTEADGGLLYELDSDPEVMRFITGGKPTPRAEVEDRVLPLVLREHALPGGTVRGMWAAEERATGAFVGWFELRPHSPEDAAAGVVELGYRLRRAAWGKGYATEGSRALIDKGFAELGVRLITANTMFVNKGSRRVMEKCGLTFLRTFVGDWPEAIEGSEHGEVEYTLSRERWAADNGQPDPLT